MEKIKTDNINTDNPLNNSEYFLVLKTEIQKQFPRVKDIQLSKNKLVVEFIAIGDPEKYLANYSILNDFLNNKLATKKEKFTDFLIRILHE